MVAADLTNDKKPVKILGNGEPTAEIDVKVNVLSKTAEKVIRTIDDNTIRI